LPILDVSSASPFNLIHSLKSAQTSSKLLYLSTSNGKGQNFIGASPERLISIHNQELTTDALASAHGVKQLLKMLSKLFIVSERKGTNIKS